MVFFAPDLLMVSLKDKILSIKKGLCHFLIRAQKRRAEFSFVQPVGRHIVVKIRGEIENGYKAKEKFEYDMVR